MALAPSVATVPSFPLPAASSTPRPSDQSPPGFVPLAIRADRCKGCELCVSACPRHCLALDTGTVNPLGYHPVRLIDAPGCTSCAICARVCPDAIFTVYAAPKAAVR